MSILDDGSHIATSHQRASFDILFPSLKEAAAVYIIEGHAYLVLARVGRR